MSSFQVQHIRALYPLFWAKSCELARVMEPTVREKAGGDTFEIEFGQRCSRATLDIIG